MQYDFGFAIRPSMRLAHVEEILTKTRVIFPIPSRRYLIQLIEEGRLDGKRTDFGYVVYEDSFKNWIAQFQMAA